MKEKDDFTVITTGKGAMGKVPSYIKKAFVNEGIDKTLVETSAAEEILFGVKPSKPKPTTLHSKIENKEQRTHETCLPVSLIVTLRSLGIQIENTEEIQMLVEGLEFIKFDYAVGQLAYLCEKFPVNIKLYVDFKIYFDMLSDYTYPQNMKIINKEITQSLIEKTTSDKATIIYIDKYYTDEIYHSPHFVVLESINSDTATIMDPWDGKKKTLPTKILLKAIDSLRTHLNICPKLIEIKHK